MRERHCVACGGLLDGEPLTCVRCGRVHWRDPKVAACVIFPWKDGVLLMRRAIEPGYGLWTFPGGYVDRGEPVEEAAVREVREEAGCDVALEGLQGVYSYRGQTAVIVVYRGRVVAGEPHALSESLEAASFPKERVPWAELAFRSTADALRDYLARTER